MTEESQDRWLRDGNLIYKLKDGANSDEIFVNMSGGSRDIKVREQSAEKLLELIEIAPELLKVLKEINNDVKNSNAAIRDIIVLKMQRVIFKATGEDHG